MNGISYSSLHLCGNHYHACMVRLSLVYSYPMAKVFADKHKNIALVHAVPYSLENVRGEFLYFRKS